MAASAPPRLTGAAWLARPATQAVFAALRAEGFAARAVGGAVAIEVEFSSWLLVCTFMLCLFLGFGKRRCEIAAIANTESEVRHHRRVLDHYTPDLLNHLLSTSGGIAIITFVPQVSLFLPDLVFGVSQ